MISTSLPTSLNDLDDASFMPHFSELSVHLQDRCNAGQTIRSSRPPSDVLLFHFPLIELGSRFGKSHNSRYKTRSCIDMLIRKLRANFGLLDQQFMFLHYHLPALKVTEEDVPALDFTSPFS